MTTSRRVRPLFYLALTATALIAVLAVSCTKHRSHHAPVIIEDPILPPDAVPEFSVDVNSLEFSDVAVWIGPVEDLIPPELLALAPPMERFGVVMQLGPFYVPLMPLGYGDYATKHREDTLWLEDDEVYTVVPIALLEALGAIDLVTYENTLSFSSVEGRLRYRNVRGFTIGKMKLRRTH